MIIKFFRNLKWYLLDNKAEIKIQDIDALQKLHPLTDDYMVWSKSSLRPTALVKILNEIIIHKRKTIVELGSGISTLYIGKVLRKYGGHIYSVEHDREWANIVSQIVKNNDLDEYVTVVYVELGDEKYDIDDCTWYSQEDMKQKVPESKVDMLIIDGPPAYQKQIENSRYPAVPFFKDRFAEEYCIVLDDINRAGEKRIMDKWESSLPGKFSRNRDQGGIAIFQTSKRFTT